jgi:hypothetical protein
MSNDKVNYSSIKNKTKIWRNICIFSIFIFLVLFFCVYYFLSSSTDEEIIETEKKASQSIDICPNCLPRNIDGVLVEHGLENLYPIGIVIDNHPDARPNYGISEAGLVYEAKVEGNITRYLAFFATDKKIEKIGPVRSARPYFLDWVEEFSSLFVHCGGSPEALARVAKDNIFDLNEFYNADTFWRGEKKQAPHNIYTSSEKLNNFLENKSADEGKFISWKFRDREIIIEDQDIKPINVDFGLEGFSVTWNYDIIKEKYSRYVDNEQQFDGNGASILADNIILHYSESEVLDEKLRLKIKTLGEGEAVICFRGICEAGVWKKDKESSRTRYYIDDKEVEFVPGVTWVEVVDSQVEIDY